MVASEGQAGRSRWRQAAFSVLRRSPTVNAPCRSRVANGLALLVCPVPNRGTRMQRLPKPGPNVGEVPVSSDGAAGRRHAGHARHKHGRRCKCSNARERRRLPHGTPATLADGRHGGHCGNLDVCQADVRGPSARACRVEVPAIAVTYFWVFWYRNFSALDWPYGIYRITTTQVYRSVFNLRGWPIAAVAGRGTRVRQVDGRRRQDGSDFDD